MGFDVVVLLKFILKFYILVTLIHFLVKKTNNNVLKAILVLTVVNIIITDVFLFLDLKIAFNNNIYVVLLFLLWLFLLKKTTALKNINYYLFVFILFSLFNLFFYEGFYKLNTKTFVFGTLIYLLLFVEICFVNLKNEKLSFFLSNILILLSSPILFFVGYSFMFGFDNKIINDVEIIKGVKLFDIISNLVNFTFYTLINIYIFKQNKECTT